MLQKEANERKNTFQKNTMGGGAEVNKKNDFQIDRTTFQVISVGGCEIMKKVQKSANTLTHHVCVY